MKNKPLYKKIILAGGTGFVGKYLQQQFLKLGYKVIIIARNTPINWKNPDEITEALEHSEFLINLAGKSVDCRYNKKNKTEILLSRIQTTKILGEAIQNCKFPPKIWFNSSTATIYRHAEDRTMTEQEGEIGTGFSVGIATAWEKEFFGFELSKTRQIALRMAIILGKDGGVIPPYKNIVRFGLGGKQGNGNQMFSWLHIHDLYRIILFLHKNETLEGVFNCSSPNPVKNKELMKIFREKMKIPVEIPTPKFLLEIGAFIIRTETELLLKSRWVIPQRLQNKGFEFDYPDLEKAIEESL
ncbi:TIGR01777 family protein [Bernardetia litoralis DSM 6794]|uniref:TIGR01777 family protein n=1 Tax=Bernardetia litoralis (strain ATCC 23117 / DSM 6794 / NBRC 15988 / NCIMB 1366 / Fx l1 / Sio-4) TaxID=880071 RepID=I4AF96_BERLS|nr:TIGR01777 family oxidoreductase [Bernardetia litoralis]AFM02631.1 TIGR01777 family protein [Bernardetia litoralis DSM 6794]